MLAALDRVLAFNPKHLAALLTRGQTHHDRGEAPQAVADFTAALKLDPQNIEAFRGRGRAYYQQDDLEKALADLNQALTLDPRDSEALAARGLVIYDQDDLDKALADYTQAIQFDRENADALSAPGRGLCRSGRSRKGVGRLQRGPPPGSGGHASLCLPAQVYLAQGDLDKALPTAMP